MTVSQYQLQYYYRIINRTRNDISASLLDMIRYDACPFYSKHITDWLYSTIVSKMIQKISAQASNQLAFSSNLSMTWHGEKAMYYSGMTCTATHMWPLLTAWLFCRWDSASLSEWSACRWHVWVTGSLPSCSSLLLCNTPRCFPPQSPSLLSCPFFPNLVSESVLNLSAVSWGDDNDRLQTPNRLRVMATWWD